MESVGREGNGKGREWEGKGRGTEGSFQPWDSDAIKTQGLPSSLSAPTTTKKELSQGKCIQLSHIAGNFFRKKVQTRLLPCFHGTVKV